MACLQLAQMPPVIYSRWTGKPLRFRQKELQRLYEEYTIDAHSFLSVAEKGRHINLSSFHENMGILGVQSTQPFADRLFVSFDLDADGVVGQCQLQINLADFLEYMEILRYGEFPSKAMLSFRMICSQGGRITQFDYQQFMHSFLLAWSTLTNHILTQEMNQRCQRYLNDLFVRVAKQTGRLEICFPYFYEVICCGNEFISAFEYIVEGSKQANFYQAHYTQLATAIEDLYARMNLNRQQGVQSNSNIEAQLASLTRTIQSNREQIHTQPSYLNIKGRGNLRLLNNMVNKKKEKVVFFGDSNWNLALNMMIGIQTAAKSSIFTEQSIVQLGGDWDKKYYFQLLPRRFGGTNSAKICKFVDYAPVAFKHLRKLFGINEAHYLKSLGPDRLLASLVLGQIESMTSMISQGKSGAMFYTSSDGQYMIKSVPRREFKFLLRMLRNYFYYLHSNPKSLLTRFFGMHQIRENKRHSSIRHYFVIMANAFNIDERIVEKYDIKGSERGRLVPPEYNSYIPRDTHSTKKDLNFLQRTPIQLPLQDRENLLRMMHSDTWFLRTHHSLDYSLLIGIIKPRNLEETLNLLPVKLFLNSQEDQPNSYQQARIYSSRKRSDQKYVFSIIDILTEYSGTKPLESFGKRILFGEGVSAVPPENYSERFMQFIGKRVLM